MKKQMAVEDCIEREINSLKQELLARGDLWKASPKPAPTAEELSQSAKEVSSIRQNREASKAPALDTLVPF